MLSMSVLYKHLEGANSCLRTKTKHLQTQVNQNTLNYTNTYAQSRTTFHLKFSGVNYLAVKKTAQREVCVYVTLPEFCSLRARPVQKKERWPCK